MLLGYLVHEVLHACTVDDEGIGILEGLHILGHELVVMETAGLWLCHVVDLNAVDSVGDIDRCNIHRIKRGDNTERLCCLLIRRLICCLGSGAAPDKGNGENQEQE